jgi:hypothetical protein
MSYQPMADRVRAWAQVEAERAMGLSLAQVIDGLYDGTAKAADVYAALGWDIRAHGRMGLARIDEGHCVSLGRVTADAGDALYLIRGDAKEAALSAAMVLNRPLTGSRYDLCPIARRICIIALTRPDLRNERATPAADL